MQKLKEHFDPPPVLIAECYHFYKRDQQPGESLTTYIAELRRLAVSCKFGDSLNDALRDRFVCGLRNKATQKQLVDYLHYLCMHQVLANLCRLPQKYLNISS